MVRDPFGDGDSPELQPVLDALDDPECRRIVRRLDEPMTASEISSQCDIPTSTTYRKLERLTDASILSETTAIRTDGHHTSEYTLAFEEVSVFLDDQRQFEVSITRPTKSADEQLAGLWAEVRKET
ncbi:helix-turn-helix domain-containing protein [Halorussus limi]|uniref:Helix-turn-helix domain-containing protein n=1 Tax=Halorussus limi TaxID=2938695 RepID=A0A8U0HXB6_9EURY|nr:helix-turn-helix domain-containing protein [Halorussus limi]UPV75371.1 helix-turn-helix domain-containing protein [Halorussus limi]